jgi:hypothetical protein
VAIAATINRKKLASVPRRSRRKAVAEDARNGTNLIKVIELLK